MKKTIIALPVLLIAALLWNTAVAAPGGWWMHLNPGGNYVCNQNERNAVAGPFVSKAECEVAIPTPVPTEEPTEEPTVEPTPEPTATEEPTAEPTPTEEATLEPTPTDLPEPEQEVFVEHSDRVVIKKMWLLTENIFGSWCVSISETHPSLEWQQEWCGFPWPQINTVLPIEAFQLNAPCAGPVYDNDVWECDDESIEWRQARWPDAEWLHGLGRDRLEVLCDKYPEYCQ